MNHLEKLEQSLRDHLGRHPADAGTLLSIIADSLIFYEKAQERKRGVLADKGFHSIMSPEMISELGVVYVIDAMLHQFPAGLTSGRSQREKDCWEEFVKQCRGFDFSTNWLPNKGDEYVDWYIKYVQPLLGKTIKE